MSLPAKGMTTSVAVTAQYILAGTIGAVYRSDNGGTSWEAVHDGLPLDPHVYSILPEPGHPSHVYLSLNSEGVFRSDDTGRHWVRASRGLPLTGTRRAGHFVLFRRDGALWITDTQGSDPGLLTVDRDVQLAALTPDGAGVAYVSASAGHWAVRVVSSGGGSGAQTLAQGSGAPPRRLMWSHDGELLAAILPHKVLVGAPPGANHVWTLPAEEQPVGWTPGAHTLRFWQNSTRRIVARQWSDGQLVTHGQTMPSAPVAAPSGEQLVTVHQGALLVGTADAVQQRAVVPRACAVADWSVPGRLLLRCGASLQERSVSGRVLLKTRQPGQAMLAPANRRKLLVFHAGALWTWTPRQGLRTLVTRADPVLAVTQPSLR
jgi:hypothetical protein